MTAKPDIILDSQRIISVQFDLDVPETGSGDLQDAEHAFRAMLIQRITELLSHNMERLMHILYRVDVPEVQVQRVLRHLPPPEIAGALADLIIERQIEKAETRARYRRQQ